MNFVVIDFETANSNRQSACSVGLVRIKDGKILTSKYYLIKPPSKHFHWANCKTHHLNWEDVKNSPTFKQLWPKLSRVILKADVLVAHNAGVDRSILRGCCEYYNLEIPLKPFICTRQLAKKLWHFKHSGLEHLCKHFNIHLDHHNALSDAMSCAKIFLKENRDKRFNEVVKFY